MITKSQGNVRQHEQTLNVWMGEWLKAKRGSEWDVRAEEVGALVGSQERPDLTVRQGLRMPVVLEFEFGQPAVKDASSRIGQKLKGEPRAFTEVLALGYADECRSDSQTRFHSRLDANQEFMSVQIVSSDDNGGVKVWPDEPLPTNAEDLQAYVEYLQVPQATIDEQSEVVASQIKSLGTRLHDGIQMSVRSDETLKSLRGLTGAVHNQDVEDGVDQSRVDTCNGDCGHDLQATSTACTVWLIAIDLQNDLALHSNELKRLGLRSTVGIRSDASLGALTVQALLAQWDKIQDVNYLPVIETAKSTMALCAEFLNADPTQLNTLDDLVAQINAVDAKHVYNFAGELWQRIVVNRDILAAHYTKPEVAELLATVGAERFNGSSAEQIGDFNLLDASCGTGTLIGAGERAIRRKYRQAGGADSQLHKRRMESNVFAMDVNGIASTLTAKRLTDMQLDQEYSRSNIAAITHPAGSLLLLDPKVTGISEVLGFEGVTPTSGIGGDLGVFHVEVGGMDWALMNPPYNRPRKGRKSSAWIPNSVSASAKRGGFNMAHGQAGLATYFGDLSNIRLKRGGVFSHVLPLTAAKAPTWSNWRRQMLRDFDDILVISADRSMSADTNLREILVVARKKTATGSSRIPTRSILSVELRLPLTLPEGYATGKEVSRIPETGAQGDFRLGRWNRIQVSGGSPWDSVGTSNDELVAVASALINGKAWDPESTRTFDLSIPMSHLGNIANRGPTHHDIGHPVNAADKIGAFEWTRSTEDAAQRTHRALWTAEPKLHTCIATRPSHEGRIVDEQMAENVARRRSRWFVKRDHGWASQPTTMARTTELCHGGPAWTGLLDVADDCVAAVALFHNSIFGAIVRDAYCSNSHMGRARMQIGAIPGLHTPAFNEETEAGTRARSLAAEHFDVLGNLPLEPFPLCFADPNRQRIDDVVADMLGLDPSDRAIQAMLRRYRVLFASEPNVNGGQRRYLDALKAYVSGQDDSVRRLD